METITRDKLLVAIRRSLLEWEGDDTQGAYMHLLSLAVKHLANEVPAIKKLLETLRPEDLRSHCRTPTSQLGQLLGLSGTEALWYLINMGYIVPTESLSAGTRFDLGFRVTALGREWAQGSEPSPEDQQGFLTALKSQVTSLDPVIEQYLQEAVAAYGRGLYFAAAVMLGAASEKAIYMLADALLNSLQDSAKKKKLQELVAQRKLFLMLETIVQYLDEAIKAKRIDYSVHEGALCHIGSLMEAIRVQRNEAVHPNASRVVPATVRASCSSFPTAYKKVDDLVQWLQVHSI